MGQNEFAVRWHGLDPGARAFLGMSILLGARGVGALLGPLLTALGGDRGSETRDRIFWDTWAPRQATRYSECRVICASSLCVMLAHFGSAIVWVFFYDAPAIAERRQIPRPGVRRRSRTLHVNDCRGAYSGRAFC